MLIEKLPEMTSKTFSCLNLPKFAVAMLALCSVMLASNVNAVQSCVATASNALSVTVNPAHILRMDVPKSTFGFTMDWFQFQNAHFRNGSVRPEVVAWLRPFGGAAYRYSGGNAFEWEKAVGPVAERKAVYANYKGMVRPEFGPAEFFDLMQQLQGKAVILLNVVGPQNNKAAQSTMTQANLGYLSWLSTHGPNCVGGANCPISYFELGNEIDWEPFDWTAQEYSQRVLPLIRTAKAKYPGIKFAVNGKTSPWSERPNVSGKDFDIELVKALGSDIDAVTLHPYYDGWSVPDMQIFIQKLAKKFRTRNAKVDVLITEHGRWPEIPKFGDWSTNWYQASGSGGALSTADFTLMLMKEPVVAGAMWHTISATGPWQLFHLNKSDFSLYPSAVYWSLRTLREGFLTHAIEVTPDLVPGKAYTGGYDIRLVAMKNDHGTISLMGVNRSVHAKAINLKIKSAVFKNAETSLMIMQGDEAETDNTDAQPTRFKMDSLAGKYSSANTDSSIFCIPPKSTFSIVVGAQKLVAQIDALSAAKRTH